MNQMRRRDDDNDDDLIGRDLLKDGRMHAPMSAIEGSPHEISRHANHLHDGSGNYQLIRHQPGFIVSDAFTVEDCQRVRDAHDEYVRELTRAWKGGAT
jgi:hypothetical protein